MGVLPLPHRNRPFTQSVRERIRFSATVAGPCAATTYERTVTNRHGHLPLLTYVRTRARKGSARNGNCRDGARR